MLRHTLLHALATAIVALVRPHPLRVAIDGVDAAGKTTLADELAPAIERLGRPVIRASIDSFHNPTAVRRAPGALYFHDSFNYAALIESLLQPLGPGGSRDFRRAGFDLAADQPADAPLEQAELNAVLLLDGVFLLRPELRGYFDFSIFVRADFEVALARAERRDVDLFGGVEEVRRRYKERYVPGQRLYLSSVQPERWASVIVDNNDPAEPVLEYPIFDMEDV